MFGMKSLCLAALVLVAAVRGESDVMTSQKAPVGVTSRILRAFESMLAKERGIRVPALAAKPVGRRLRGGPLSAEKTEESQQEVTIYLFESDVCDVAEFRSAHVVPADSFGSSFAGGCSSQLEFECVSVPTFTEEGESSVPEGVYVQATCGSHPNRFG